MKYKQPIVVLSLLLFLIAVALSGFLLYQRNQEITPLVFSGDYVVGTTYAQENVSPIVHPSPKVLDVIEIDLDDIILPSENNLNFLQESSIDFYQEKDIAYEVDTNITPLIDGKTESTERIFSNQRNYKVSAGDTVSDITVREWGNLILWPDLYVNNQWIYDDPDLILPGEVLTIFDKLGNDQEHLSDLDKKYLTEAYLKVYHLYAKLGERRNASKWYTLKLALRVEPNFFEIYANQIEQRDIDMVNKLQSQSQAFQ